MATIKPSWTMPDPPQQTCSDCGNQLSIPVAIDTGDGWLLAWDCPKDCGMDDEPMIDIWPFVENTANWMDLEKAGFDVP